MSCEALRERLNQDPAAAAAEFARHAESCPACAAYGRRVQAAEAVIRKALAFDVGMLRSQSAVVRADAQITRDRRANATGSWRRTVPVTALAALVGSVVGGLIVWFLLVPAPDTAAARLAQEVVEHWYQEPESWARSATPVSAAALDVALDGKARIDLSAIGPVTYARSCFVAGQWVPHLVVQGEAGPFMVLLLPEQRLASPVPLRLEAEGLSGRALPAGRGSIAVLGADGEESGVIEAAIAAAVRWTI